MSTELRRLRNYIDGEFRDAADGRTTEVVNPATGEAYATAPLSGQADGERTGGSWNEDDPEYVPDAPPDWARVVVIQSGPDAGR